MPRRILKMLTASKRIEKADRGERINKKYTSGFVDPFPEVIGTLPEKMVYEALSARNISFLFVPRLRFQFPDLQFDKTYEADVAIPDLKIIIEVQGAYWHSKPATVEGDALKFAVYQTAGWRPLAWWDYDILRGVDLLFEADPQLSTYNRVRSTQSSELAASLQRRNDDGSRVDASRGIKTLNHRRKRPVAPKIGRKGLRKTKSYYSL